MNAHSHRRLRKDSVNQGFTVIELLVASSVLVLACVLILSLTSQTSSAVKNSGERVEAFQSARQAFDSLTRQLSQATLNTYYDYFDSNRQTRPDPLVNPTASLNFAPRYYGRQSDLHFISGNGLLPGASQISHSIFFQAPIGITRGTQYSGLENALNACGYFIKFASDEEDLPESLRTHPSDKRNRFRLYRWIQPTENLTVFNDNTSDQKKWFTDPLNAATDINSARQAGIHPLADNVVALVILPKLPPAQTSSGTPLLAPDYNYDSKTIWTSGTIQPQQSHQLPPLLDVAMITIDEISANRLLGSTTTASEAQGKLGITLSGKFVDATKLEEDLKEVEGQLAAKGVNFRTFRTTVPLRGSKWSKSSK